MALIDKQRDILANDESINAMRQGLIELANDTTMAGDTTLSEAVRTLIDGYGQGGGGGVSIQEVDVVFDNRTGTLNIPCDTYDNALIVWNITQSGVYTGGVLTMDTAPTVPLSRNIPFSGTGVKLSNMPKFSGYIGTGSHTNFALVSAEAIARTAISLYGHAIEAPSGAYWVVKTATGYQITANYSFGYTGYYFNYHVKVYGWNDGGESGGLVTGSLFLSRTQRIVIPITRVYNHIMLLYDDFTPDIVSPSSWSVYGVSYNKDNIGVVYRVYTTGQVNNASYTNTPRLVAEGVEFNIAVSGSTLEGNYTYYAFD